MFASPFLIGCLFLGSPDIGQLPAVPPRARPSKPAPAAEKWVDVIELVFSESSASGTGHATKGGFTFVPVESDEIHTKVAVSLAGSEDEKMDVSRLQLLARDKLGKRHEPASLTKVSAGGRGLMVYTLVAEFKLNSGRVDSLIVRRKVAGEEKK